MVIWQYSAEWLAILWGEATREEIENGSWDPPHYAEVGNVTW